MFYNFKTIKPMHSFTTPAEFILKQINEGLEYDNSIKKILISALDVQIYELRMSSETYLFKLPDAKELLNHYLDGKDKCLDLTFNGQTVLLENPNYEDLLFHYISIRALDNDAQMLIFKHKKAEELFKLHIEKHDVSPQVYLEAKQKGWIPNCPF